MSLEKLGITWAHFVFAIIKAKLHHHECSKFLITIMTREIWNIIRNYISIHDVFWTYFIIIDKALCFHCHFQSKLPGKMEALELAQMYQIFQRLTRAQHPNFLLTITAVVDTIMIHVWPKWTSRFWTASGCDCSFMIMNDEIWIFAGHNCDQELGVFMVV